MRTWYTLGHLFSSMTSSYSTRVKATIFSPASGNSSAQLADNMKATGQSSSRDPRHRMKADTPEASLHGNTGDRCSGAGRRQIVLATNRNGGMLWLNATRHDNDDDGTYYSCYMDIKLVAKGSWLS